MRRLSPRRLPSTAAFPTAPAVLRAIAPLNQIACISASCCALNRTPNRETHDRDIVYASATCLPPIRIAQLALIQFP
jgi:hypothetical protein